MPKGEKSSKNQMQSPLALTIGEPAGIGPDIAIAAWTHRRELRLPPFYIIGDAPYLAERARRLGRELSAVKVTPEGGGDAFATALPVVDLGQHITAAPGAPDQSSAPAAIAAIRIAVAHVLAGAAAAVVTNPVAKNVLYRSGFPEPGHTEFLGKLATEMTGI